MGALQYTLPSILISIFSDVRCHWPAHQKRTASFLIYAQALATMASAQEESKLVPFGKAMRESHFSYAKGYTPLNHGSYGASSLSVRQYQQELQNEAESRPDLFLRRKLPQLLDESRVAVAPLLGVPVEELVFLSNATTAVNTVLRNLTFKDGDVILYFSTVYDTCEKTVEYICESTSAESLCVELRLPMEDDEIVAAFETAVASLQKPRKRVKVAMFDTVLTFPGVKMPWEKLVKSCKALDILSLVDGAHGVGHIDLTQLGKVSPDFFTSNCYKWLFTPRGSAIFHVPKRNHYMIRSSLPTSHGFRPKTSDDAPKDGDFGELFAFVGTMEISPYICALKALEFREKVCGGEENIRRYCTELAQQGGQGIANTLGTRVMSSDSGNLQDCCFTTVQLPLHFDEPGLQHTKSDQVWKVSDWPKISKFIMDNATQEYDTFLPVKYHAGYMWARVSAQIYLEMSDFEFAGRILKDLCDRVEKGDHERSL